MRPVEGSMKTAERPGSTLMRSRSRFVCTDLVPDAACGGVNEDRGEAWVRLNAFSFQICLYWPRSRCGLWESMKTEERPGSALMRSRSRFVCTDLVPDAAFGGVNEDRGEAWVTLNYPVPDLSVLTSFQMRPVEGSMKTEERPGSALMRSRSWCIMLNTKK
jgi:hypothetical protein